MLKPYCWKNLKVQKFRWTWDGKSGESTNLRNGEISAFHLSDHSLLSKSRRLQFLRHTKRSSAFKLFVSKSPFVCVQFPLFSFTLRKEKKSVNKWWWKGRRKKKLQEMIVGTKEEETGSFCCFLFLPGFYRFFVDLNFRSRQEDKFCFMKFHIRMRCLSEEESGNGQNQCKQIIVSPTPSSTKGIIIFCHHLFREFNDGGGNKKNPQFYI